MIIVAQVLPLSLLIMSVLSYRASCVSDMFDWSTNSGYMRRYRVVQKTVFTSRSMDPILQLSNGQQTMSTPIGLLFGDQWQVAFHLVVHPSIFLSIYQESIYLSV